MVDAKEVVKLALLALGPKVLSGDEGLDETVCAAALAYRSQLSERSLAMRVLSAVVIPAEVVDVTLEESSRRLVVRFVPDRRREGADEVETIRTDRTDGVRGEAVRRLWRGLEGRHVRIYKVTEDTGDPSRPKVRVAPYVELVE